MKKFVGLVNGKSFDNEKDWTKAAQEALKENDGNLAISSYYTYTSDDAEKVEETKDDRYVSTSEYFLGDRKPDKVEKLNPNAKWNGYTNVEYSVSPELEERLKVASNKNNIKESIDYHVTKLSNNIKSSRENLSELEKEVEEIQNELYEQQSALRDLEARRKYYNHLLDIIELSETTKKEEKVEEPKVDEESTPETKEFKAGGPYVTSEAKKRIKELLNIDEDTPISEVLRQLGILK